MKNKTFKIKLSHLIIGGILLLLLIFLVKCKPTTTPTVDKYTKEKKEIDSLQTNIFLLKEGQRILTSNVNKQVIVIDSLEEEIIITEKELTQTRTYYDNKIKDLTGASNSELDQFFTNRYQ
jgi:septal ring factor EnvC (AmiA/AmiB activator)